ncbi:MAG: hemolysin family protein [Caldilinea sp.]|nr:hemolysin family protein [Caldilinea sp.]MDW8441843.1 hemolysin family protein [Caldilineaceae bacterium]
MESDLVAWIVLAAALFFIGLAAAAEIALSAVNRSEVRKRSEAGDARALMLSEQLADTARFWLTIMLLKSLGLVAAGLAAGYMLSAHFPVSGMLIGIPVTWLTLAAAQIVVRSLVLRNPDDVAFALAPFVRPVMQVLSPVTFLLYRAGLRVSGENEEEVDESIFLSEDGLRLLMQVNEEESEIQESEKQMIAGILEMDETVAREVMVPRIDMVTLDVNTPLREALDTIIEAGHSRIPVYEGNIDAIVGVLYAKDLLKCFRDQRMDVQIRELLRPPYFIPASKKVTALLREMQQQRVHLAIVIDEYGGVAGLVTIEDILEEIVGDIQDEYDVAEETYLQPVGENTYLVHSRLDLDTLSDVLGIDLEEEEADTVGGLIYSHLGHVPEQGETLELDGWRFIVLSVEGRRIDQVRIERVSPTLPEGDKVQETRSVPGQNSWLKPSGMANQS